MKKVISWLLFFRSIPCFFAYLLCDTASKQCIEKDVKAYTQNMGLFHLHTCLLFIKVFRRQFFSRILRHNRKLYYLCRWSYSAPNSLSISVEKNWGGGTIVYHGSSTIVFADSIGENFSVYQNVTIGRGKTINGVDIPSIGNNVTVYSGANVIGGITIGNCVKIGAGAVVNKDVPSNCTVVGNPMRIITKE